jgi:hypothetical protein
MNVLRLLCICFTVFTISMQSAAETVVFQHENLITQGMYVPGGTVDYNEDTYTYHATTNGGLIGDTDDVFYYVYNVLTGDFSIRATITTSRMAGLMIRDMDPSLSPDDSSPSSAYALALIDSDGNFNPNWRDETFGMGRGPWDIDEFTISKGDQAQQHNGMIELERSGSVFTFYYYDSVSSNKTEVLSKELPNISDPVYVGLAIIEGEMTFNNVTLQIPTTSVQDWQLF